MSTTEPLVRAKQEQVLLESIRQRRHIVLTHHSAHGWRTFKASFLRGSEGTGELVVRATSVEDLAADRRPQCGDRVGCTFRAGHKKCMFCCEIKAFQQDGVEATVTLTWPARVQQLRRRAYERATPPADTVVAVRFWRDGPGSGAGSDARDIRHGQLEDISCGGLRLKVPEAGEIELEQTYKCVFAPRPGKPSLVLDAILRHREAVDRGRASLGFQFVGLETTPEGMRTLDRLARVVGHYQRGRGRRRPNNQAENS